MTLKLNADRQNADFNPIPFSFFSDFRSFLQNLSLTNQISEKAPDESRKGYGMTAASSPTPPEFDSITQANEEIKQAEDGK